MSDRLDPYRLRCTGRALVMQRQWKTCIRPAGHGESHVWMEDPNVVGRPPVLVVWDGADDCADPLIADVHLREPRLPRPPRPQLDAVLDDPEGT